MAKFTRLPTEDTITEEDTALDFVKGGMGESPHIYPLVSGPDRYYVGVTVTCTDQMNNGQAKSKATSFMIGYFADFFDARHLGLGIDASLRHVDCFLFDVPKPMHGTMHSACTQGFALRLISHAYTHCDKHPHADVTKLTVRALTDHYDRRTVSSCFPMFRKPRPYQSMAIELIYHVKNLDLFDSSKGASASCEAALAKTKIAADKIAAKKKKDDKTRIE